MRQGTPPRWTPRPGAPQLREDDGVYYRDKNASRFPDHPMEPAIRAILELHPAATSASVDVVACGSTLGNLLRFVRGEDRDFRMLVESVVKVVHLIRRENSPTDIIQGIRGYGHTFPEAYTSWDTATGRSASHQRVLRYEFGGLNFVVRHEGDGYLPEMLSQSPVSSQPSNEKETDSVEALIGGLANNTISQAMPELSSQLQITRGGSEVPQSAVFDLKTRSILGKGRDFLSEELPRMWVAQTPNFIIAYHTRGTFDDIEIKNATSNLQMWEKSMNGELAKLAALIHHIVEVARKKPDGKLELNRTSAGKLEVRDQTPGIPPVLSEGTLKDWKIWIGSRDRVDDLQSPQEDENADSASDVSWGNDSVDFTACSNECGYCGNCTY